MLQARLVSKQTVAARLWDKQILKFEIKQCEKGQISTVKG